MLYLFSDIFIYLFIYKCSLEYKNNSFIIIIIKIILVGCYLSA